MCLIDDLILKIYRGLMPSTALRIYGTFIFVHKTRVCFCSAACSQFSYGSRYGRLLIQKVKKVNSLSSYGGTLLLYWMYYCVKRKEKGVISPAVSFIPLHIRGSKLLGTCSISSRAVVSLVVICSRSVPSVYWWSWLCERSTFSFSK